MNYISRFVRGAGYYGCSSALNSMVNNHENPTEELLFQTGIEGYEAAGTAPDEVVPALNEYPTASTAAANYANLSSNISAALIAKIAPLPRTDILAARVGDSSGIEITENNESANFRVNYTGGEGLNGCGPGSDRLSGICPGDSLIISDCKKSLAFVVSDVDGLPGTNHTEVKILHKSGTVVNGKKNIEGPFVAAGPEYQFET